MNRRRLCTVRSQFFNSRTQKKSFYLRVLKDLDTEELLPEVYDPNDCLMESGKWPVDIRAAINQMQVSYLSGGNDGREFVGSAQPSTG